MNEALTDLLSRLEKDAESYAVKGSNTKVLIHQAISV